MWNEEGREEEKISTIDTNEKREWTQRKE